MAVGPGSQVRKLTHHLILIFTEPAGMGQSKMDHLESIIQQAIVECLELPPSLQQIELESPLFGKRKEGGLELDSLASLEIMAALSDRFDLPLDDVEPADFRTISSLADYLRRHGVESE